MKKASSAPAGAKADSATAAGESPKAVRKTRRKRSKASRKAAAPADALPDTTSDVAPAVEQRAAASTGIRPYSSSAQVEHNGDAIVIRFPDPEPVLRTPSPAPPAPADDPPVDVVPDVSLAPDEPEALRPAEDVGEEPPSRTKKRRRRRRRKDPREGAEADAPKDAAEPPVSPPAPDAESDSGPAEGTRAPDEEPRKSGRRRRRKRRRGAAEAEPPRAPAEVEEPDDATADADDEIDGSELESAADPDEPAKPPAGRRRSRRPRRQRSDDEVGPGSVIEVQVDSETDDEEDWDSDEEADAPPTGDKEMVINVVPNEECRIAILETGKLQEIYLERASSENHVGNIYKGIVTNVEPSIQAAFIDFGIGKNGFLHISDLHPDYFPGSDKQAENVGRKVPRRNRPPIQQCLRRGQEVLVQITKEGIGTKGPTLTNYLSIPGRFLVMMPGMRQLGVSRKVEDEDVRRELRARLQELELPEDMGFIARTAAVSHTKRELQSDLSYLSRLWKAVEKRIKKDKAPAELYTESDLVIRTIRDVYTNDVNRIVIDDAEVARRASEFLSVFSPRSHDIVVHYDDPEPIFHKYGIEAELERLHSRHVPLKSGGSLVIDQAEALVAIDVNSGRFRSEDDAETTAYKINLEAADEIARQLRLRDLGGVVICDFIDMRLERHKREIERRLAGNLRAHKERAKVLRTSAFGIIELTRQRQRASLTRSVYRDCASCRGTGLVKSPESVALDVMRQVQLAVARENVRSVEVAVSSPVADLLQNRKRSQLHSMESRNGRRISIRADVALGIDQIHLVCYDRRGRVLTR